MSTELIDAVDALTAEATDLLDLYTAIKIALDSNVATTDAKAAEATAAADLVAAIGMDVSLFVPGVPTDAETLLIYMVNTAFTLPVDLTTSNAYAAVTSTAAATISIEKNGSAIGTVDFAIGANAGTFTFATETAFAPGDRLSFVNQGTADATLATISVNLHGDY